MGVRTLVAALMCFFVASHASAQSLKFDERALSISDIPACGITCLFLTVPRSGCSFDDIKCQCENDRLKRDLGACMLANCTMADTLGTAKVQADLCNLPNESRRREIVLYTSIVFSIAVVFVTLRVVGKVLAKRISWDDWILVVSLGLTVIPCGCILAMTYKGFGDHLWNLERGQLKEALCLFWISWSTYALVLGMIKVSLVFFYLQIFQTRGFKIAAYIVLGYIIASTMAIFLATIFSCIPVQAFWNRDIKGKCIDINALAYANSGNAIANDVTLLILPLVFIRKLNMQRYRKIAVGLMFAIGTFGAITTIIRLHTLLVFRISVDPTWDYVPVTIWTELELASGFVCVSLPAIRILLTMILPQRCLTFFASIASRSSRNNDSSEPGNDVERQQGGERKGLSWLHIPTKSDDSTSFGSSLWSRSGNRTKHNGSMRLESIVDHMDINDPPPPPLPPKDKPPIKTRNNVQELSGPPTSGDMLDVPRSNSRQFCASCGDNGEYITALPRIGCLPDGSYSREDVQRHVQPR
ncbi:hypothetical protein B0J11DRAFT_273798 [Dendryphion nanum]|uniref:CFEM domain-containing protein n=1 Tax=Dendryphion nanum TaxID=256645 RepID=A0A9P9E0C6_9PLEO|nr:hypothetical protein B0J11DRAFT_273798 [Dendryphion nanum]